MRRMRMLEPGPRIADPLEPYAQVKRSRPDGRCWLMAHMVGGLDGSAAIGGRVGDLSTAADAELFRLMRALADVVLVGAETVRAEHYGVVRLPPERAAARVAAGKPATPPLAVVTRSLELDWSAKAFADARPDARTLVITCAAADPRRLEQARQVADVIVAGQDRVDPELAAARLTELGQRVVVCEGGPRRPRVKSAHCGTCCAATPTMTTPFSCATSEVPMARGAFASIMSSPYNPLIR